MPRTRYTATDSTGEVHVRTSASRTYTHAVVFFIKEHPSYWSPTYTIKAYKKVEWAGRLDLAQANARKPYTHATKVEIIEAVVSQRKIKRGLDNTSVRTLPAWRI